MTVLDKIKQEAAKALLVSDKVSAEEAEARLEICRTCDRNQKGVCALCGCFIEVKVTARINFNYRKLRQEVTHCPAGKWNDKELAEHYQ